MRIIPAIDLIEGKCVRLTRGDYSTKKIYDSSPLDVAKRFEDAGIQFLHLVDLDGAKSGRVVNFAALESIASKTNLTIDFGGGVKSKSDLINVFNAGASQITAGSIAVKNPDEVEQWIKEFGPEKIILGADYKQRKIAIQGWEEQSDLDIGDFISTYLNKGIKYAICTDISKDGMLEGPSLEIYTELINTIDIQLIASGGITSLEDLQQLKAIGCEGAIIGKAIYEGKITLKELEQLC